MKKIIFLCFVLFTGIAVEAKVVKNAEGSALADLLDKCLLREEVTPDSIYYNIELLEREAPSIPSGGKQTSVKWLVYRATLAKLYAERADIAQTYSRETKSHPDSIREWSREEWYAKSAQLFREVLSHKDLLYKEKAEAWLPVVSLYPSVTKKGGKDAEMLSVVWISMCSSLPDNYWENDSVLSARSVIDFYIGQGRLEDALFMEMTQSTDSVLENTATDEKFLKDLKKKYDSLALAQKNKTFSLSTTYKNLLARIENDWLDERSPIVEISVSSVAYPGDPLKIALTTRNQKKVHLRIYSLPLDLTDSQIKDEENLLKVVEKQGKLLKSSKWIVPETKADSIRQDTLSFFTVEEPGRYALVFIGETSVLLNKKSQESVVSFVSTRLYPVSQTLPEGRFRVSVVDAKTGEAVKGVMVSPKSSQNRKDDVKPQMTDERGVAVFDNIGGRSVTTAVSVDSDVCCPTISGWGTFTYREDDKENEVVNLYTDRAIYRPGQKVQVAGIVYDRKHWNANVKADAEYTLQLMDNRGKEIASQQVKTDSMGTFSTTFTLSEELQLGTYRVQVGSKSTSFRVEEYKRPKFYVELEATKTASPQFSQIGRGDSSEGTDTMVVSGRVMNYNGTPVAFARVTGQTKRVVCWWKKNSGRYSYFQTLDTLYTDAQGRFSYTITPPEGGWRDSYFPTMCVEVSVLSSLGETEKAETSFRIYPDPPQPQKKKMWIECTKDTFSVDENAVVKFLATGAPVHILAFAKNAVVMDRVLEIKDSLDLEIPYKEEYGDGMAFYAWYVKEGTIHSEILHLAKKLPDSRIRLHWETFRDYTQPGKVQHWTLAGEPSMNLMLTLYDSALDAYAPHKWNLKVNYLYKYPYSIKNNLDRRTNSASQVFDAWRQKLIEQTFGEFDEKYFAARYEMQTPFRPLLTSAGPMKMRGLHTMDTALEGRIAGLNDILTEATESIDVGSLRQDFSETGVFLPQLRADKNGRVSVCFTLPESLTTWHLMGIAQTKDMRTAIIDEKIIAQKNLMAELALPRFVRRGDRMEFGVKVARPIHPNPLNEEEGDTGTQNGMVTVEIVSATDTKKVLKKIGMRFVLECSRDTTYTLTFDVPNDQEGLTFRVLAKSSDDSDGEMREIPVLSDLITLTDSKAVTLAPGETQTLDVDDLFPNGSTDRRVIVEKTINPVATAVDALKPLLKPECNDALSWASAFYAYTLLGKEDRMPYIHKVAEMQNEDGSLSWFQGMRGNEYITREVALQLLRLPLVGDEAQTVAERVLAGARHYLLECTQKRLEWREKNNKEWNSTLEDLQNVYVFQKGTSSYREASAISNKILAHLSDDLVAQGNEYMALVSILKHDTKPLETLQRRLTHSDGYYIAYPSGNRSSIDRRLHIHTRIMEAFSSTKVQDAEIILKGMRLWLLNEKRTQGWKNSVNCTNAVWALSGFSIDNIQKAEIEGSGFSRDTISFRPTITIGNTVSPFGEKDGVPMWAGIYATYTMPMENVEKNGEDMLIDADWSNCIGKGVGDKVTARIILTLKRDYEYVKISVPRAASLESEAKLSGCSWKDGMSFYREIYDCNTEYFFPSLPAGTYILEDGFVINCAGEYSTGIPTIECQYAEEFRGHGKQSELKIGNI